MVSLVRPGTGKRTACLGMSPNLHLSLPHVKHYFSLHQRPYLLLLINDKFGRNSSGLFLSCQIPLNIFEY